MPLSLWAGIIGLVLSVVVPALWRLFKSKPSHTNGETMTGPKCPACGARPLTMDQTIGRFPNGILASLIFCHDCGYVLPAFMCGVDQPDAQQPEESGPRLVG